MLKLKLTTSTGNDGVTVGLSVLPGTRHKQSQVDGQVDDEEGQVHVVVLEVREAHLVRA